MIKKILVFCFLFRLLPILAQEGEKTYFPETDPLVQQKLEQWQDLEIRPADALGSLQSMGNCRILVDLSGRLWLVRAEERKKSE